jgi:hypothetical protein
MEVPINHLLLDQVLERVRGNAVRHSSKEPDLAMLLGEISELAYAIAGRHEHNPDTELVEIAAICINWLRRLRESEIKK